MSVKFAFIGCSNIAKKHAVSLERIPEASLVAVCDIEEKRAKAFGEDHCVDYYTDYKIMLNRHKIDVVSILTPSGLHAENILQLAPYKKHIVVEKPIALRLEDADEVIKICDKYGIKLFVVQQNRYNLPVVQLKKALDEDRLGKLTLGTVRVRWCREQAYYDQSPWRGTWALDGGVLTNQASHHIDMLSWLMGPVESVMAMTGRFLANIEAEDTGIALLKFSSGALGIIEATTATRPKDIEGSISILGEKGSVEIGGFFMNELKTWQFELENFQEEIDSFKCNPDAYAWNHTEYLKDVINSINANSRGLVDGLEGRKSIELINALYESAETGKEIYLKFKPNKCKLGMKA